MDVSPIQRMAISANSAARPVQAAKPASAPAPAAQAAPAATDNKTTDGNRAAPGTQVVVSWHPASLGYVTRVVDQHTGSLLYQSPPDQILDMVEQVIARLEGDAA